MRIDLLVGCWDDCYVAEEGSMAVYLGGIGGVVGRVSVFMIF